MRCAMAYAWEGRELSERRHCPRLSLSGEVQGKVRTMSAVPVIDLSASGALLEAHFALNPCGLYWVQLAFNRTERLDLRCRVVRSYVHDFDRNERGERVLKFRAGVEFITIEEQNLAKTMLQEYIERLERIALQPAFVLEPELVRR